MAIIELNQTLPTHRKTRRLARALGLAVPGDIPQVVGHLCMFWLWCVDNAPNGSLAGLDPIDIADAAGWPGNADLFYNALVSECFVDENGRVHDWDEHIGKLLIHREKERERNRVKQQRRREREKLKKNEPEKPVKEEKQFGVDPEWLKVVQCYEANIGLIPHGVSGEMLVSYMEDLSSDVVCEGIKITNEADPNNKWQYLKAILDKWVEKEINTLEKVGAYKLDLKRRLDEHKRKKAGQGSGQEPPAISGGFY